MTDDSTISALEHYVIYPSVVLFQLSLCYSRGLIINYIIEDKSLSIRSTYLLKAQRWLRTAAGKWPGRAAW